MTFESFFSVESDPEIAGTAAMSGLIVGTAILTLEGEIPVQFLAPGDRVITRSGAKLLKAVEVSLLRNADMIRVRASALGHDRPEADCFIAPGQKIMLRDWRAKALYGADVAMVEAQRLTDGDYIRPETVSEIRLFTLKFEQDEVIYVAGLELACEAEKAIA